MLDVLVVGGGPVGLYLGCLLAQQGLSFQILERRHQASTHSRAIGLHPPVLEAFEQIDVSEAFLKAGLHIRRGILRSGDGTEVLGELGFQSVSKRYPFILSLPQQQTEQLLERRLKELALEALQRGVEVIDVADQGAFVSVLADCNGLEKQYLARLVVGADGCRSLVRTVAGLAYLGGTYDDKYLMGDFPDTTVFGSDAVIFLPSGGVIESFPLPHGIRRWVAWTAGLQQNATAQDLAQIVKMRTGWYIPANECRMLSAFEVRHHLAQQMVKGRIVLLGDAAHEVSPIGGQGMNLGWLDALALAPLLLLALENPTCLDSYQQKRKRSAVIATKQAEYNMWFGRPAVGLARQKRIQLISSLLNSPAHVLLANAFTMRWL